MKKNTLFPTIILATAISLFSCKKEYKLVATTKSTDGLAYLAVIDASPNFRKIFNMPDSFNIFVNGQKISGFAPGGASQFMSFGKAYPPTTTGFGYVGIPAGTQQIKLSVSGVNLADSVTIATFTKTLAANQQYSFIITDSVKSSRDSSQIFLQDVYSFPPTVGYYNVRFVNAVWNDTATVDLYSYTRNTVIYSKITPGAATSFTQVGANLQTTDTLYVTRSLSPKLPSTTPLSQRTILAKMAFQGGNQKSYTVYYQGDFSLPTANKKSRSMSFYRHE
jgi:Domain of unknown function (DUF4397)